MEALLYSLDDEKILKERHFEFRLRVNDSLFDRKLLDILHKEGVRKDA
jgi:hypothetical protein